MNILLLKLYLILTYGTLLVVVKVVHATILFKLFLLVWIRMPLIRWEKILLIAHALRSSSFIIYLITLWLTPFSSKVTL